MIERLTSPRDDSVYNYQGWKGFLASESENLADKDPGILEDNLWFTFVDLYYNWFYYVWMMSNFVVFGNLTTW